jgi:hypothetical protein
VNYVIDVLLRALQNREAPVSEAKEDATKEKRNRRRLASAKDRNQQCSTITGASNRLTLRVGLAVGAEEDVLPLNESLASLDLAVRRTVGEERLLETSNEPQLADGGFGCDMCSDNCKKDVVVSSVVIRASHKPRTLFPFSEWLDLQMVGVPDLAT